MYDQLQCQSNMDAQNDDVDTQFSEGEQIFNLNDRFFDKENIYFQGVCHQEEHFR